MKMNDLEMCAAIAEIEGKKFIYGNTRCIFVEVEGLIGSTCAKYNPITDLALNCALRDKHKVEIAYWLESVTIDSKNNSGQASLKNGDVCRAVIECILKANGLYVGANEDE